MQSNVCRKIIQPFEKALSKLQDGSLIGREYCAKDNKPLMDNQSKQIGWSKFNQVDIRIKIS